MLVYLPLFNTHWVRSIMTRRHVLLPVACQTLCGHEERKWMLRLEWGRTNTSYESLGREYETDKTGRKERIKENLRGRKTKRIKA